MSNKITRVIKGINSISCIILFLLITGCTNTSIEKKIINKIEDGDADKCEIVLAQLTEFKWDKMIVSNHSMSPEQIEAAIGMDYPYWKNNTRPMIFFYKNKIIHYENNEENFERFLNDQVVFHLTDSLEFLTFTPQTAFFTAKKIELSYGEHYFFLARSR